MPPRITRILSPKRGKRFLSASRPDKYHWAFDDSTPKSLSHISPISLGKVAALAVDVQYGTDSLLVEVELTKGA